jgi:tetratricopeptide (TPR) repeat protein
MNFFNTEGYRDPQELSWYLSNRSPEQVLEDVRSSRCDPNDILCTGDVAYFMLKNSDFARVFYEEGLRALDANPGLLAADIDPLLSRRNLCAILMEENKFDEALRLFSACSDLINLDPNLAAVFAWRLHKAGAYRPAFQLLERVLRLPPAEIAEKVKIPLNTLQALYADNKAKASVKRLYDLKWFWSPEVEPVPEGIMMTTFESLAKKGVPDQILVQARSAVIMSASNDRKMWFIFFYDRADPTSLLEQKNAELFFASFYHRDGNVGIADVHC